MAAESDPSWAPGDEVDVLLGGGGGKAQWWPGAVVGHDDGGAYRVRLQGAAGGLRPPRGCGSPAPQEEGGVTPGRLAPAGMHVPRWRLCAGGELVEVKVRALGRVGKKEVRGPSNDAGRAPRRRHGAGQGWWRAAAVPTGWLDGLGAHHTRVVRLAAPCRGPPGRADLGPPPCSVGPPM